MKRNPVLAGLCAVVGSLALASGVWAQPPSCSENPDACIRSDGTAGLIVFPKIRVDRTGAPATDTLIQLSNTSDEPVNVRCYLVNANSHCSNIPDQICSFDDECGTGAFCLPGWTETDFRFTLTKFQPIIWQVSEGLTQLEFPLDGFNRVAQDGQFNELSAIPPAPEDPFQGELKCFQVDGGDNPVARNDLKGEATILRLDDGIIDARKYNGVGLPAQEFNDGNDTLCLGGSTPTDECPEPEYAGCPNIFILNHYFDFAIDDAQNRVVTDLTMVPCSENFRDQTTFKTTVQFLVFNEFEQRLSTSKRIECFEEIQLSNIDTRPSTDEDNYVSIWSIGVQATLTGQSRIRAVQTSETDIGHGILVVAEEFHGPPVNMVAIDEDLAHTDAFNVQYAGSRDQGDVIRAQVERGEP